MKIILPPANYTYTPSLNRVDFSVMGAGFDSNRLLAIINIKTGSTIYATGSAAAGLGGTFVGNILTYASSNAGQLSTDPLQIFYEDAAAVQPVSGTINVSGPVEVVGTTGAADALISAIYDGSGTFPILSTPDALSGRDGLDINLQSSSYGGLLNNPLPLPYQNQALSVGFINGGDLVAPALDPVSNELQVQATLVGVPDVNIARFGGTSTSLGQKAMTDSMPVVLPSDQTVPVSMADLFITGASGQTLANNNALLAVAGTGSTDASGFRSCFVQVVSTATAGNYTFECSANGTNFVFMPVVALNSTNGAVITAAITATASSLVYAFPISARFIRLRISSSLTGGSIQCFTRLSAAPYQPLSLAVAQSAAANLLVTASIAASQTLATVSAVNSAALSATQVADIASSAITTTQTSANIATTATQAASFGVFVSAISGAGAAMDVQVQETMNGTEFYTIYTFERITAIGQYYSPAIKLSGSGLRYLRTISGTTPSVTNSVNRIQRSGQAETVRRFINRAIDPNTLNSNTGSFFCDGVEDFNLIVRCTAQTTAATIALQFSMDNTNWYTSTTTVTTVNGIEHAKTDNQQWKFVRATVTAAGTGITLGEVTIGGHSA
jgi:hypothetical protein